MGTKSGIDRCLEDVIEEQHYTTPSVEVVLLDVPTIMAVLKPAAAIHFREYAHDAFLPYVERQQGKTHSIGAVWDNYTLDSLKAQTRDTRGK